MIDLRFYLNAHRVSVVLELPSAKSALDYLLMGYAVSWGTRQSSLFLSGGVVHIMDHNDTPQVGRLYSGSTVHPRSAGGALNNFCLMAKNDRFTPASTRFRAVMYTPDVDPNPTGSF